jgi:hypothetical protein
MHQYQIKEIAQNGAQPSSASRRKAGAETIQKRNNTGLPDRLKSGMENLSGMALDHVKVHYNSPKPAAVQAHAYAQGSDIHLASGQSKHLPHELGHVVQQMQGRVKPTTSVAGLPVNDNVGLEREADRMGHQALQLKGDPDLAEKPLQKRSVSNQTPVQRLVNTGGFTGSQNSIYGLDPADTKILYSTRTATAPAPDGLYRREQEVANNGTLLYRYKPNVRLYSKAEKNIVNEWYDGSTQEEQDAFSQAKPGTVNGLIAGAENPAGTVATDQLPTLGMLGDNDCKGFATTLRGTIAGQGTDNRGLGRGEIGVGDQMVHTFSPEAVLQHAVNCGEHSATVVAKDGNSLITLEAHAGQDITEPDFHMRNGIQGFIVDNNRVHDLGNASSISRADGDDAGLNARKGVFRDVKADPMSAMAAPYDSSSMVTENPLTEIIRREALLSILALSSKYWGKFTEWKFKPTGVSAIQTLGTGVPNTPTATQEALAAAKRHAIVDRGRESDSRHPATADFYMAIARMNLDDIPSLSRVVRNMAHITREMEAGHTGKSSGVN